MRLDSYEFHDCQASVQSGTAIERLSREITECVFSVEPKPQHVRVQLSVLESGPETLVDCRHFLGNVRYVQFLFLLAKLVNNV